MPFMLPVTTNVSSHPAIMVSVTSTSEILPPIPVRPASPVSPRTSEAQHEQQKQSVEQVANSTQLSDDEIERVQRAAETARNERRFQDGQNPLTLENNQSEDAANGYGAKGQSNDSFINASSNRGSLVDFYV
ncbi:MAG: hypothetical protein CMO06_19890 [Thalassospira sp.]|uniref:hypothetical protein n=1 Tax=Thalassospira sp. TaxID=1912094 RepID=UPI000C62DE91|nr:hypothetical protein [Thalassospira sp.]MAZ35406.1 hypothetical protein [Thalassospira sp.]|tara:strand:- start:179 stop:574 length:396 start_codon:yes stop_codon:yes gene_type:complete